MTELWNSRGLLYFFVWRDIKVRYKQTILGGLWAIIQPLLMMVTFSVFFGVLSKIPSGDVPYPLFSYVGILPWLLFSEGVARATNSLIYDANLIQKVYYPRMLSPMASIISPLLDFAVALVILAGMMVYFNHYPNFVILVLPLFLGLELLLTLGIGLWLSAINIQFRDMRYAVPLLIQLGLFA